MGYSRGGLPFWYRGTLGGVGAEERLPMTTSRVAAGPKCPCRLSANIGSNRVTVYF